MFPGIILQLSYWYRPDEIAVRCVWICKYQIRGTVVAVANIHKMLLAMFPALSAVCWPMASTVSPETEAFRVGNGFSQWRESSLYFCLSLYFCSCRIVSSTLSLPRSIDSDLSSDASQSQVTQSGCRRWKAHSYRHVCHKTLRDRPRKTLLFRKSSGL